MLLYISINDDNQTNNTYIVKNPNRVYEFTVLKQGFPRLLIHF